MRSHPLAWAVSIVCPDNARASPFGASARTCWILDADPLADIHYLRKLSPVMRDGRGIDRATLPQQKVLSR